jgi:hypothetical protein
MDFMNDLILRNYWPWAALRTPWTRWLGNISLETASPQIECGDINYTMRRIRQFIPAFVECTAIFSAGPAGSEDTSAYL